MQERYITFRNGQHVCPLGQGTYQMGRRPNEEIQALCRGIELGLTLIDTAEMYGTEELVGRAVRNCRDKAFIVSKVLPSNASYEGTKRALANEACTGLGRITSTSICCTGSGTIHSPKLSVPWWNYSRRAKSGNGE